MTGTDGSFSGMDEILRRIDNVKLDDQLLHWCKQALSTAKGRSEFVSQLDVTSLEKIFALLNSTTSDNDPMLISANEVGKQILDCIPADQLLDKYLILKTGFADEWTSGGLSSKLDGSGGIAGVVELSRLIGYGEEDGNVSQAASAALRNLIAKDSEHGFKSSLRNDNVQQQLNTFLRETSTIRFRFYELLIKACESQVSGAVVLKEIIAIGYMGEFLKELDGKDILSILNALELLAELAAKTPDAARYLHETKITPKLNDLLVNCKEAPDGQFIFPAVHPADTCTAYPLFLQSVFQLVLNYGYLEVDQRLLSFDTLALIGASSNGRAYLHSKHQDEMRLAMNSFGAAVTEGPVQLRSRHLEAFQQMFTFVGPKDSKVLQDWFSWMGDSSASFMGKLLDLYQQIVAEIHIPIGKLFVTLTNYDWANSLIIQTPGFIEYILDRNLESEMEGRYNKHSIVTNLLERVNADQLGPSVHAQMVRFQKEGPFYVKARAEVAMESAE